MDDDGSKSKQHCKGKLKELRKTSLPLNKIQNRITIEELRQNYKRQISLPKEKDVLPIHDPMAKAQDSMAVAKGKTGVIYNESSKSHHCLWDPSYPEHPGRLACILSRCKEELDLFSECEVLDLPPPASEEFIETLHSDAMFNVLKGTQGVKDAVALEDLASQYDSIYFHPDTFSSALMSAGCVQELVKATLEGKIQNGMAIVRPPGHHAMRNDFCGYCYFNNVALAAKFALEEYKLKRILIVDWDVHHGQGVQRFFYEDPRVLYFSSHRYEQGTYWPNLRESDFDHIGAGLGKGYNFNFPLNALGMKNGDFLALFHQVLLPVAYEYNPELVLICSGYDAAVGCPEGLMSLTPAIYAHLTTMLMSLAGGKVVVALEGGYCLESLAEGAAYTLQALMGKASPMLLDPIETPSKSMRKTILNVIYAQRQYWKCLQFQDTYSDSDTEDTSSVPKYTPEIHFVKLAPMKPGERYQTKGLYPQMAEETRAKLLEELKRLKEGTSICDPPHRLCVVYDANMEKHENISDRSFPERPARTKEIMNHLKEFGILQRTLTLESRRATVQELKLVHDASLIDMIIGLPLMTPKERATLEANFDSIYFNSHTQDASLLAAGCLLQVVDSVCKGESRSGIAVVRPPGHHAEKTEPYGFCIFNNVSVACAYALQHFRLKRILVVDWDVHHGNGIQHAFESDPRVLYVSIHLYKDANFFPYSVEGDCSYVGKGPGKGFNINIPWSKSGMGDAEYISALQQVVLPVAYQFDPELVLVAAGFDAGVNDPLGGCCVTPECFGHMTHMLTTLAGGRVILALEGGYNIPSVSYSMVMCAKALLGDPLPPLKGKLAPCKEAVGTLKEVILVQQQFWSCLRFLVSLPEESIVIASVLITKGYDSADDQMEEGSDAEFLTPPQTPPSVSSPESALPPTAEPYAASILSQPDVLSSKEAPDSITDVQNLLTDLSSLRITESTSNVKVPSSVPHPASLQRQLESVPSINPLTHSCEGPTPPSLREMSSAQTEVAQSPFMGNTFPSGISHPDPPSEPSNAGGAEELEGAVGGVTSEEASVTLAQLMMAEQEEEMFAVVPLSWCPHMCEVSPVPPEGLDHKAACEECHDLKENWLCLSCYKVLCGRYVREHMRYHGISSGHNMVLSYADLSVWCYACESYVHNEAVLEAKSAAHKSKFGEICLQ